MPCRKYGTLKITNNRSNILSRVILHRSNFLHTSQAKKCLTNLTMMTMQECNDVSLDARPVWTVPWQPFKWSPEGLENVYHRLLGMTRTPTLLRLEAWPPGGNITGYTPKRLHNLVQDPPIQPYTLKRRNLILASSIPDSFMRPRMVPRVHIAPRNVL